MNKKFSKRRDPHLLGLETLAFDNVGEEISELSDKDKTDIFYLKFMDTFDPIKEYESYFKNNPKSLSRVLKEIKNYYSILVLQGDWSERKYAEVLARLFQGGVTLNSYTLEKMGNLIDNSKKNSRGNSRRRRL